MADQNTVVKLSNNINKLSFSRKHHLKNSLFFFIKSLLVQKLINVLMKGGKKIKSECVVINYLNLVKKKEQTISTGAVSFFTLLEIARPQLEIVFVRKGKRIYSVPVPIRHHRQYLQLIRCFKKDLLRKKNSLNFFKSIAVEHFNILLNTNKSVFIQKQRQIFNLAIENRMFTHFR